MTLDTKQKLCYSPHLKAPYGVRTITRKTDGVKLVARQGSCAVPLKDAVAKAAMLGLLVIAVGIVAAPALAGAGTVPPPLQQLRDGIPIGEIVCNEGKTLLQKDSKPACVTPNTAGILLLRGWEIMPQSKQNPEAGVSGHVQPGAAETASETETPQALPAPGHLPTNGSLASVYEPIYYVADNKITLLEVEKKIPNPSGVWFPVTTEEAVNTVMPRLASGLGDRLILPAVNMSSNGHVIYGTEMGNKFRTWSNSEYPDVIRKIEYRIYEKVTYEERDEFLASFMDNAGFPVSGINSGRLNTYVYGGLLSMWVNSFVDYDFIEPYLQLNFRGWLVGDLEGGSTSPRSVVEKRAFDFAMRHTDLFDEEQCIFTPLDEGGRFGGISVHAGVPVYDVIVGHCTYPPRPDSWRSQSVLIAGKTGEVAWFSDIPKLVDDWIERIDIPESAKVGNR